MEKVSFELDFVVDVAKLCCGMFELRMGEKSIDF
jgi:hypothetical protein